MKEPDTDAVSDAGLAAAAAGGDRHALEALLGRHADRIHAVCRRIVGNPEDALDATQEAMIAVVRGITRFDGRCAFTTWLYRVATNAALDESRRRSRRPMPVRALPEPMGDGSVDVQVGTRLDVDAALARLPEEFRVAVVLRDLCDLDYAEIAEYSPSRRVPYDRVLPGAGPRSGTCYGTQARPPHVPLTKRCAHEQ